MHNTKSCQSNNTW